MIVEEWGRVQCVLVFGLQRGLRLHHSRLTVVALHGISFTVERTAGAVLTMWFRLIALLFPSPAGSTTSFCAVRKLPLPFLIRVDEYSSARHLEPGQLRALLWGGLAHMQKSVQRRGRLVWIPRLGSRQNICLAMRPCLFVLGPLVDIDGRQQHRSRESVSGARIRCIRTTRTMCS